MNGMDPHDVVMWAVTAANLPEHGPNPIHTAPVPRPPAFPRALVAGVTTYAYLTHPIVAAWGEEWLRSGGGESVCVAGVRPRHRVVRADGGW